MNYKAHLKLFFWIFFRFFVTCIYLLALAYYSKTCVRQPPLKLTLVVDVERWLSYKGTCHVILLAKLHDMYLYKTDNFFHINHYLKSVSKVALLHRFYCNPIVLITTATDEILSFHPSANQQIACWKSSVEFFFLFIFSESIRLDFSCESSA